MVGQVAGLALTPLPAYILVFIVLYCSLVNRCSLSHPTVWMPQDKHCTYPYLTSLEPLRVNTINLMQNNSSSLTWFSKQYPPATPLCLKIKSVFPSTRLITAYIFQLSSAEGTVKNTVMQRVVHGDPRSSVCPIVGTLIFGPLCPADYQVAIYLPFVPSKKNASSAIHYRL